MKVLHKENSWNYFETAFWKFIENPETMQPQINTNKRSYIVSWPEKKTVTNSQKVRKMRT